MSDMNLFLPALGSSAQLVVQDELKWNQTVVEALKIWTEAQRTYSVTALELQKIVQHLTQTGYGRLETRGGGNYQNNGV